jgi:hypothetical protein
MLVIEITTLGMLFCWRKQKSKQDKEKKEKKKEKTKKETRTGGQLLATPSLSNVQVPLCACVRTEYDASVGPLEKSA